MIIQRRNGRIVHGVGLQRARTPARLPGLVDWFDAGFGITLNAGNVSQWVPRIGGDSTHNLVQATALKQPLYVANDPNFSQRPTVYFASLRYLRTGTWTAQIAQPIIYYVVAKLLQSSSSEMVVDGMDSTSRCTFYNAVSCTKIFSGVELGATATSSTVCVYACEFSGATSKLFRNDSVTPIASGNVGTFPLKGLTLGVNGVTLEDSSANAYVSDLVVCAGKHDAVTRQWIMRYLGVKNGVATT